MVCLAWFFVLVWFVLFPRDQQELKRLLQNRKEISSKDSLE